MKGDSRKPEPRRLEIFKLVIGKDTPPAIEATKPPPALGETKPPIALGETKPPIALGETKPPAAVAPKKPPLALAPAPTEVEAPRAPPRSLNRFGLAAVMVVLGLVVAAFFIVPKITRTRTTSQAPAPAPRARRAHADPAVVAANGVGAMRIVAPEPDLVRRDADAVAQSATDATRSARPPFNGYLYDLPRNKAFASAWRGAVSELPGRIRMANRWLATLEASAAPNRVIQTSSGTRYAVAWGCDPRACQGRTLRLVYNLQTNAVAAAALLNGTWHTMGSDAEEDRAALLAAVARERLGLSTFPLHVNEAAAIERFVAAVPN